MDTSTNQETPTEQNTSIYQQCDSFQSRCSELREQRTQFFKQLPYRITDYKQQYILRQASLNERLVFLCIGALSVATVSAKMSSSFVRVIRNTLLAYGGAGIFVVPEVFNPYLIFRYNKQQQQ